ncbi:MAG: Rieske (2Fe-2S) protein, partial [Pseudomonas aeruginosa]|nr:Rieske (2Fe-2S) protein [Pseudomonas aeruginosa]
MIPANGAPMIHLCPSSHLAEGNSR